jgi:hypothetical protein
MGVPVVRVPGDELFQEPEPLVGISAAFDKT